MSIRVVIVDDHVVVRVGLRLLLETDGGFTIVGEAREAASALAVCTQVRPDLAIVDLQMSGAIDDGLRAISGIRELCPQTRILVFSQHTDDNALLAALTAGAHGFCAKNDMQDGLLRAARGVAEGEVLLGAGIADRALKLLTSADTAHPHLPGLTGRQREVLALMASGLGDTAIGRRLGISRKTVQNHASAIIAHLQATDRSEAVERARAAGLGLVNLQIKTSDQAKTSWRGR